MANTGKITSTQVIGPCQDVSFAGEKRLKRPTSSTRLKSRKRTAKWWYWKCQQHLRTVTTLRDSTEGLSAWPRFARWRPLDADRRRCEGRLPNVIGQAIDAFRSPRAGVRLPIHRNAPAFERNWVTFEVFFFTGIKVLSTVGSLCKVVHWFAQGGCRRAKPLIQELINNVAKAYEGLSVFCRRGRAYPRGQ
jgi:F-type H+-transporting ATPase subunit beta